MSLMNSATPGFNAIMGFSDIIQSKTMGDPLAPVYAAYATHIYRSGEHLLEIVNEILDMSKIESAYPNCCSVK